MLIKMTSIQDDLEQYGLLPMIHYVIQEVNQGTTVFMDEGSNTSLITTKLANALFLKGKVKLTTVLKACDRTTQSESRIHHEVILQDRHRVKHKVRCIKVPFITKPHLKIYLSPFQYNVKTIRSLCMVSPINRK